jgi:cholest-4-en-3-one 26-monooxygenase
MIRDIVPGVGTNMIMTDPPRQQHMRRIVNAGFSPRGVRRLERYCRDVTRALFDRVLERGECEFVGEIAAELPLQVIAEILGVPSEDRRDVFSWTNRALDDTVAAEERLAAMGEMYRYANELAARRRSQPTDDILSAIANARIPDRDGNERPFDEIEILNFFQLIATGGSETTRNAISGGLLEFLRRPDQLDLLRAQRDLMPRAVEEILRWTSPVNYFRRTATRDVEIRGQAIEAGEKVTIWYCSANRDEDVFERPFEFDVTRWPNEHLTFGAGGAHYCLGANLAKLEIAVVFEELLDRMTDIEVAGEIERFYTPWFINVFGGYKKLPLRFRGR